MDNTLAFNFDNKKIKSGFRLHKIELLNWGTFNKKIWEYYPEGESSLLTGAIGSGKTSVADAVTTLLVPHQLINFNKASGSSVKDRSIRTYVEGHYKSERNESSGKSKPVGLRGIGDYSVILGVFKNDELNENITLAQVFWLKDSNNQPDKFFVCSENLMNIKDHFTKFGNEIMDLKKKLRTDNHTTIFDSFKEYGAWYQRKFGIKDNQAIDLFHQTVSMKSVSSITNFVREHMLDSTNIQEKIDELTHHYDDLNRAHKAILKAEDQINLLSPLIVDCDSYEDLAASYEQSTEIMDGIDLYFDSKKVGLCDGEIVNLKDKLTIINEKITKNEQAEKNIIIGIDNVKSNISSNGGGRIQVLSNKKDDLTKSRDYAKLKYDEYLYLTNLTGLLKPENEDFFRENLSSLKVKLEEAEETKLKLKIQRDHDVSVLKKIEEEQVNKQLELDSLHNRKNNIDFNLINIRKFLSENTGIDVNEIPFAGELIRVKDTESKWEGSIERVLHGFATSMLVPERHLDTITKVVNENRLKGRLHIIDLKGKIKHSLSPLSKSMVHKVDVKENTEFSDFVEAELINRFDYVCCDSHAEYLREHKAITENGMNKNGSHHVKDDRFDIRDTSKFVLGWSNLQKVKAITSDVESLKTKEISIAKAIKEHDTKIKNEDNSVVLINKILMFKNFSEIDWMSPSAEIDNINKEISIIEQSTDVLKELKKKLNQYEADHVANRESANVLIENKGKISQKILDMEVDKAECERRLLMVEKSIQLDIQERINLFCEDAEVNVNEISLKNIDLIKIDLKKLLSEKIKSISSKKEKIHSSIIWQMQKYKNIYTYESADVDASIEAIQYFKKILNTLIDDDLPKYKEQFESKFHKDTVEGIFNFCTYFNIERNKIKEKIGRINKSMSTIPYAKNRYICLEIHDTYDVEIKEFRQDLAHFTNDKISSPNNISAMDRFIQVKELIQRLAGRPEFSNADEDWKDKVTDVRNWYTFSASERSSLDDSEFEHYTDSDGKSGGQKEKLAYTILAAGLAYQFNVDMEEHLSRTFRLVLIDEAFSRGDDNSASFAFQLFQRLGFQLIVVTPMQKVNTIENFVSSVGFVYNVNSMDSRIETMTIDTYHEERSKIAA